MAVILTSEATSKEEAAGLAAHQHVILQLHNDLGGNDGLSMILTIESGQLAKGYAHGMSLTLSYMAAVYHFRHS